MPARSALERQIRVTIGRYIIGRRCRLYQTLHDIVSSDPVLDALFKLFMRVELAQQTRFLSVMAYAKTIQEKEKKDTDDVDNGDKDDDDTNVDMNKMIRTSVRMIKSVPCNVIYR